MCFNLLEVKLSNIVYDYIEDYLRSILPKSEGLLKDMEVFARENNVPIVQPEVAKFLSFIIKSNNAEKILEIGTAIGYSAILMHNAAGSCRILTIERNPDMYERAEENIKMAKMDSDIKILKGEADEILGKIDESFDLIFLDAAKGQYLQFFPECDRLLKKGGIIFADNVLFRGMVTNRKLLIRRKITIVKRLKKYIDFMMKNKNYETSVLPLGDGVSVSVKIGG
jgi:predicted O-methyltransferase YrrM